MTAPASPASGAGAALAAELSTPLAATTTVAAGGSVLPRLPGLDAVRGVAIAMVMIYHFPIVMALGNSGATRLLVGATAYLRSGVDLFFVLSGFLITGILLATRDRPGYFRTFYARRALRIFPLYYATLVVLLFGLSRVDWVGAAALAQARAHQGWYWSYLLNVPIVVPSAFAPRPPVQHFWSLAVEEQFYLVWPFAVLLARTERRLLGLCALGILLNVAARSVVAWWHVPFNMYFSTIGHSDGLLAGAMLAVVVRRGGRIGGARRGGALAAAAAVLVVGLTLAAPHSRAAALLDAALTYALLAAGGVGVVLAAMTAGPRAGRVWQARPLVFLGRHSYALYVLHLPLLMWLASHQRAGGGRLAVLARLVLYVAGSVALALASRVLIEEPFLRLKRHVPVRAAAG